MSAGAFMSEKFFGKEAVIHKETKWAKQIISMQRRDGAWGDFHTLSGSSNSPLTTERALQRLERLGFTIKDECIERAIFYMSDCLSGKREIPDRREKLVDWDMFTSLILSTWIRRFTKDVPIANQVAGQWGDVISQAFHHGAYAHEDYIAAYQEVFGGKTRGARLIKFVSFYTISLVQGCLDKGVEEALMDYVLNLEDGIHYIYEERLTVLPPVFASKQTSHYLAAIELLTKYRHAAYKLQFVVDWLNGLKNENGKWNMGKSANDKVYFPLSDNWRKQETREADCTERIMYLLSELSRDGSALEKYYGKRRRTP